jgi:hypothetical protein
MPFDGIDPTAVAALYMIAVFVVVLVVVAVRER